MDQDVDADVAVIRKISAIPSILEVVCQATGMGFAAVARVTPERWIACEVLDHVHFGLTAGSEVPIRTTLCDEVRAADREIVIDNVSSDPAYRDHHTPRIYGLQSYISVPIRLSDGSFFGTLCAVDARPTKLKGTAVVGMFRLFSQLIAHHIDDQLILMRSQADLAHSIETGTHREQFIVALGHDLRDPLTALELGTRLLRREPQTENAQQIITHLQQTSQRMMRLVEDLQDLASGRLDGVTQSSRETRDLTTMLDQIVAEIRILHPTRRIDATYGLDRFVTGDHVRLGRLFANLLSNAVVHGSPDQPIRVIAKTTSDALELSVANAGAPIPPEAMTRLFQPFFRGDRSRRIRGLGLGLYIAAQIAQAHNGRLGVSSDAVETKFTFTMPLSEDL